MSVRPGSCLDDARVASSKRIRHVALHIVGVNEHRVIASAFEVSDFLPRQKKLGLHKMIKSRNSGSKNMSAQTIMTRTAS